MTVTNCSNDPASAKGEPPELPEFAIEPDLSYFDNDPQKAPTYSNYYAASWYAVSLAIMSSFGTMYQGFFYDIDRENAKFKNGKWVWQYKESYQGASMEIKTTAEEKNGFTEWEMTWSYDDGQGNSVKDYTMMTGRVANDGTSGSWTFNTLESEESSKEIPVFKSSWTKESDTKMDMTLEVLDEETGGVESTYSFSQDGHNFRAELFESNSSSGNILVVWNTETMTGYYQEGGADNRFCWNADFEDVPCSS